MKKTPLLLVTLMMSALLMSGCSGSPGSTDLKQSVSISVTTTVFPLYVIAQQITGDKMNVELIVLPGNSPHTFTPTPKTKKAIDGSQRTFAIGHHLDDWVFELIDDPSTIILTDKDITLRKYGSSSKESNNGHVHNEYDPHYWLDPRNAKTIADTISAELIIIDPKNQNHYTNQLQLFKEEMDLLYTEQVALMKPVHDIPFLTMHDAWFYYTEAFGLNLVGSFNPSGAENPTPKYLQSLQDLIDTTGAQAIFNEPQLPVSGLLPFIGDNDLSLGILDPFSGIQGIELYSHLIRYNSKELIANLKSTQAD
jgi:zinc transport system substrate-binding protein